MRVWLGGEGYSGPQSRGVLSPTARGTQSHSRRGVLSPSQGGYSGLQVGGGTQSHSQGVLSPSWVGGVLSPTARGVVLSPTARGVLSPSKGGGYSVTAGGGGTQPEQSLATWRSVCLLRPRRRTFLLQLANQLCVQSKHHVYHSRLLPDACTVQLSKPYPRPYNFTVHSVLCNSPLIVDQVTSR